MVLSWSKTFIAEQTSSSQPFLSTSQLSSYCKFTSVRSTTTEFIYCPNIDYWRTLRLAWVNISFKSGGGENQRTFESTSSFSDWDNRWRTSIVGPSTLSAPCATNVRHVNCSLVAGLPSYCPVHVGGPALWSTGPEWTGESADNDSIVTFMYSESSDYLTCLGISTDSLLLRWSLIHSPTQEKLYYGWIA